MKAIEMLSSLCHDDVIRVRRVLSGRGDLDCRLVKTRVKDSDFAVISDSRFKTVEFTINEKARVEMCDYFNTLPERLVTIMFIIIDGYLVIKVKDVSFFIGSLNRKIYVCKLVSGKHIASFSRMTNKNVVWDFGDNGIHVRASEVNVTLSMSVKNVISIEESFAGETVLGLTHCNFSHPIDKAMLDHVNVRLNEWKFFGKEFVNCKWVILMISENDEKKSWHMTKQGLMLTLIDLFSYNMIRVYNLDIL